MKRKNKITIMSIPYLEMTSNNHQKSEIKQQNSSTISNPFKKKNDVRNLKKKIDRQ